MSSKRSYRVRIYSRCPACGNDTLTINKGHLLCTWHDCPSPTAIDHAGQIVEDGRILNAALKIFTEGHSPEWWLGNQPEVIATNALRSLTCDKLFSQGKA